MGCLEVAEHKYQAERHANLLVTKDTRSLDCPAVVAVFSLQHLAILLAVLSYCLSKEMLEIVLNSLLMVPAANLLVAEVTHFREQLLVALAFCSLLSALQLHAWYKSLQMVSWAVVLKRWQAVHRAHLNVMLDTPCQYQLHVNLAHRRLLYVAPAAAA